MMRRTSRGFTFAWLVVLATFCTGGAAEKTRPGELDMHHPKGWTFTMPKGDPVKGRSVFEKFSCYSCHEVRGENFPPLDRTQAVGPELSQMGPLHPLEYFTESIVNPDAVGAKKYRGPDGKSKMPTFNADMTVQELIDLSAYLAALRPKGVAKSVKGVGKIVAVVPQTQEVVVDHEEIEGFMDAMVMGYKVSPGSLLKSVKPGDKVRFTIDTDKRAITKFEKVGK
ncbi:MAG TPA: copper-binding protein [candidate division Zixibacteria bacterium]|nr:copper-binding protein [candidate division Zixibacteria bacterium]